MSVDGRLTAKSNAWPFVQRAFVWAIGSSGLPVADLLAGWSIPVVLFQNGAEASEGKEETGSEAQGLIEVLRGGRVLGIDGHFGSFRVRVRGQDGRVTHCEAGFVVIYGDVSSQDRNMCSASVPEANSLTIEELEALASSGGSEGIPKSVGVWLDPREGWPDRVAAERALRALLSLRTEGDVDCYVMARHIPLWGLDGQSLYDALRENGVRFLRLGEERPDPKAVEGRVELVVQDQTVSDCPVSLRLDRVLLLGQPSPLAGTAEVARLVGDPLDSEGFLQKDNAHLYPSHSFRKGIYYVGSCKGEQAAEELAEDVGAIFPSILEPMVNGTLEAPEGIRIDRGHCVSCLTCYRVCPHHAIDISQGPVPVPVDPACYGCGLCAALCPGNAIELVERPGAQILGELDRKNLDEKEKLQTIVFCCSRSALGSEGAVGSDLSLPAQTSVIDVPCACSVSEEMLLAAFLKGADKVVVVGCHPDNCVSQRGSAVGQKRTERVAHYLAAGGRDAGDCVRYVAAAPNEAHRLSRVLRGLDPDYPGPEGRPVAVSSEGETS
jgi:coenzyme F420-reducing hydrogenase delta subunit/NAD-dependent dihydropyrimidine dehydrogenase PreA subunit